jgi:hypothetical protein
MHVKTKDPQGNALVINTDHVLFYGQAADGQSKAPLLGHTVIFFIGYPAPVVAKIAPEDLWKLTGNTEKLIAAASVQSDWK